MPYIKTAQRAVLDPKIAELAKNIKFIASEIERSDASIPGMANYVITALLLTLIEGKESYATYNAALGVLESVKLELYREQVAPRENQNKFDNGEITAVAIN